MRMSVEIPVEPEATSLARDVVASVMVDSTAPPERVEDALLLTTEVVSHAVRLNPNSEGSIGLLLDVSSDRLRVEVTDQLGGPAARSMSARSGGEADGGWGLIFVAELSDRWGAEPDSIWFELALQSGRRSEMTENNRHEKGDFAKGERTEPTPEEGPDFAKGERTSPVADEEPDFARGERTKPTPDVEPDFARGERKSNDRPG